VRQRTQLCNKIRWFLHELNPSFDAPSRGLRRRCVVTGVEAELDRYDGVVARLAPEHLARCAELNQQIAVLDRELNN
jgi:transposase